MKTKLLTLSLVAGALLAPATASATDAEIQQTIKDGSAKVIAAEKKLDKTGSAFEKKETAASLKKFRAAIRAEEDLVKELSTTLKGQTPDTPTVGEGRDLIVKGLDVIGKALDRMDKALGKATKGKKKAAQKSVEKALKEIEEGNALIEEGEPKAGAELTPNTDTADA